MCKKCAQKCIFRSIGREVTQKKERSDRNIKELSAKEKLFCTYYSLKRNSREAAAKSGYSFPERSGTKLLKRKEIEKEINRLDKEREQSRKDIAIGYFRLAFGCVSDSVKLLFKDDITEKEIEEMDFFNVSEIKRKKGGDVEIKFFDRQKALDSLTELSEEEEEKGSSIYEAIEKGALALKGHLN